MRYLYLVLGLLCGATAFAQTSNSTTFILPNTEADSGTNICLPITAINFSSGVEFSFAIQWEKPEDGGALTFDRVVIPSPTNVPFLGMDDFDFSFAGDGLITVEWGNYLNGQNCRDAAGTVTLDDGEVLFEICFDVSGPVASNHPVSFFNKPNTNPPGQPSNAVPIVFNKPPQCNTGNDAFPGWIDGSVTIGVKPLILTIPEVSGNFQPGDTYCVDVNVESGFEDLKGMQFGIQFDSTVIRATSTTINPEFARISNFNFNLFRGSSVYAVWNAFPDIPYTIPDGGTLFTVCFEIVGDCSDLTDIVPGDVVTNPNMRFRPADVNGENVTLASIPFIGDGFRFIIDDCNPTGFDVVVDCPDVAVNFGDTEVCVQFRAGTDFVNMTDIDYLINFDPSVLEFVNIDQRNPAMLIDENTDFDFLQAGNGVISFDWAANGASRVTLAEGDVVFAACFNAIGFGGTSPVVVSDFRNQIESTDGFFDGLNPTNCAITVQQPDGVAVSFPDVGFSSTEDICFDVTVDGFTAVTDFSIYVFLPLGDFDFRSFVPSLPGIAATELPGSGLVQLTYTGNGDSITIPDGGSIGSMCYRATDDATPGDCVELGVAAFIPSTVVTTGSGGNSVNVEALNGEACVLFPNGFGLIVGDATGFVSDQVCVPVSVTRFTDVVRVATSFNFSPSRLTYSSINLTGSNWPGLTVADFDDTNAGIGRIDLNWSSASPGGTNIADQNTVLVFEICFDTGVEDGCLEVTPTDAADPATTTATGPGSIVYRTGEICLEDRLILLSISSVPASCDDTDDGMIIFETAPRADNTETITIRTDQPIRFGNNGSVGGLLPGMVNYIIYNEDGLRIEGAIEVGVDPANAAVANAGDDGMLSCGDNPTAVISGRNNTGETWELFIVLPDGVSTRRVSNGDISGDGNLVTSVNDPGTYIAEVTSAAGCTARDTLIIEPGMNPIAMAGDDLGLDCNGTGALLSGLGSSEGGNVAYQWTRVALDGTPLDTVGDTRDITVMEPGRYVLEVTFTTVMCSQEDMVLVRDENNLPNSVLPTEAALNCDGSPVMLSIGPAEDDVVYTWTESGDATVLSAGPTYATDVLGTFVVDITNSVTGCSRSDTVIVVPSRGVPEISFPTELTINCEPDTTQLTIAYENVGPDTRYSWSSADGRVVITDLSVAEPRVTRPGTYKVIVSNGVCRDSATVVVGEGLLPTVEAGMNTVLTCVDDLRLTGSAESLRPGAALSPKWVLNGADVPMGAALSIVVSQPGTYYLEVTDDGTGCVGVDSIVVSAPTGFPTYELADTIRGLGCAPTTVGLRITGDDVSTYDVRWLNPSNEEIGTMTSVRTGVPGMHMVSITNPATGCTAVDSVLVIDDAATPPLVTFRQNSLDISCEGGPAIVDAAGSSRGNEFSYVWSVVMDGEEPSSQGNDTLIVRTAGVYRLTITNQANGCINSRDVTVTDSRVFPRVEAVEGMTLDCENRSTVIGINILDQPNDYDIQWSGPPPSIPALPMDTNRITVTKGGTYNAVIINPTTSCVETVVIRVEDLIDSIATLAIMTPDSFDCNNSTITIDASDTELNNASAEDIVWTSFDGNNITPPTGSLIVSVDGPGDYELSVTDASGCVVRDTVTVEAATDTPFAQAGDPIEIECGEMPQLDGTSSTPGPLPGILYDWSATDGGEVVSGENTPRPFVSGPGTYQLIVTNLANGCSDTSSTTVMLNEQVSAMLPADFTACGPPILVEGNLPPGTSGEWTAFNDEGSVWTAEESTATITEIGDGLSLVWTLSSGLGCENYSADTVRVGPEETPVANDDLLEIVGNDNIGSVNLLANDQRTGPVTVNLLTEPEFGTIIINLNGDVTFEAALGTEGITTVDYEVCSVTCPDLCSQATLTIRADPSGVTPEVYNAISPNGDGMNDRFIFTLLELRPDEFPDNEIIIFNRWGDIIYEAKPYNNDWEGVSNSGTMVPEGTYYYILRLNVGEGDIIRGDVTVVR